LINFLEEILSDRHIVIKQDCQSVSGEKSTLIWLKNLYLEIVELKNIGELSHVSSFNDVFELWSYIVYILKNYTKNTDCFIIIAIDEYEELHKIMKINPAESQSLLSRIRSFLQEQNRITFLFTGAISYVKLVSPDWKTAFVQAKVIKVEYFTKELSLKLIETPIKNFSLTYAQNVSLEIYTKTQGHPHLIQQICQSLVNYANQKNIFQITFEILVEVINNSVLTEENAPCYIFWDIVSPKKDIIIKIINGQKVKRTKSLKEMEDAGYLIFIDNKYKIHVPIFEEWARKFKLK
jgi:hypothetical protein